MKHKTAVCKTTLDPVWRETFDFSIVDCNANSNEMLILRLFDWDWATDDDFMGEVEIPFSYLASEPGVEHSEWFTVNDDKTGMIDRQDKAVSGRVLLRWTLKYIGGAKTNGAYGEPRLRRRSTVTRPNVASKVMSCLAFIVLFVSKVEMSCLAFIVLFVSKVEMSCLAFIVLFVSKVEMSCLAFIVLFVSKAENMSNIRVPSPPFQDLKSQSLNRKP
jgi:hypothetical protein